MSKKVKAAKTEVVNETPVQEVAKRRGRPVVEGSARQAKLAKQAEILANGGVISRGRPADPNSKRQARLNAQKERAAAGIEVKVGRPKGSGKKVEAEVVEAEVA